jgi:hypothetical protein
MPHFLGNFTPVHPPLSSYYLLSFFFFFFSVCFHDLFAAGLASVLFFGVRSPKYESYSAAVIALWLLGGVLGIAAVIVWGVQAHDNIETVWLSAVPGSLRFRLGFSFGLFVTTTVFQFICAGLVAASRLMKY